jgi:Zn-finger nucleic acid-binding protein
MFILEFEQVEVDYCHRCGGVWLDSGELEMMGRMAGALQCELLDALAQGRGASEESNRRCPICRATLAEVRTETDPPIAVDRCGEGHGLWFDRGELRALVQAADAPADNILAKFFAELGHGAGR